MSEVVGRGLPAPVPRDRRRVVIENVTPVVDGGRFPVKRGVGEPIDVEADVFADGDDLLRVMLRHRVIATGTAESAWTTTPMRPIGNDRWTATFVPAAAGYAEYAVVAWVDQFETWRRMLDAVNRRADDVASELLEGAELVRRAANAARAGIGGRLTPTRELASERLRDWSAELRSPAPSAERVRIALSPELGADMAAWSQAASPVTHVPLRARVERPEATKGAWYALAPAPAEDGQGDAARALLSCDPDAWLAEVSSLGFDVVTLPEISAGVLPTPASGRVAYPGLGTHDDVLRVVDRARQLGLDVAIDLAFHGVDEHPYVTEHPEWFRRRPDGTLHHATGPTGRVTLPLDFEGDAWESLWEELKRVVSFWVALGVRAFHVDAPDAKPLAFWEWLIAEIHRDHPDVIFVAGACTKPTRAARLAKIGFTQSVVRLETPLSQAGVRQAVERAAVGPARDFTRLHLAVRSPDLADLDPLGHAAQSVDLVLAATAGDVYRCGDRGLPDEVEAGSLLALARQLNEIRKTHPSFQLGSRIEFHDTDNPKLLCFSRRAAPGSARLVIVVNLDAGLMQHGWVELPAGDWGMTGPFDVHDLLRDETYRWQPGRNYVRLEPESGPAHVLSVG